MTPATNEVRTAFFGLGIMGSGMAHRLLGAGHQLTIYNRSARKAEPLVTAGARLARTPREAVPGAHVVISMVADDAASRGVWLGDEGALAAVEPGSVLVECSTLTTTWIRELAATARERGCALLDAPVTGSKTHAAAGELKFLVGGDAPALDIARPLLAAMGREVVHVGPTGSGALLKLINNFLCGVQAAALAQAVALIERAGLDRDTAAQVLANGAPGSPLVKGVLPRMTSRDYAPNFYLSLMAKDLSYALQEAERCGITLSTARTALDAFQMAIAEHGQQDFAAVVETVRGAPSK
jgi:3-hydroxyisobutyrate dehydrogenase